MKGRRERKKEKREKFDKYNKLTANHHQKQAMEKR
jgi:hypothetical protein